MKTKRPVVLHINDLSEFFVQLIAEDFGLTKFRQAMQDRHANEGEKLTDVLSDGSEHVVLIFEGK